MCYAINEQTIEVIKEAGEMNEAVRRIFRDELEKERAEGEAKGKAEGKAKGIAEGEAKGFLKALTDLVTDGIVPLAEAAHRANMSVTDFQALILA